MKHHHGVHPHAGPRRLQDILDGHAGDPPRPGRPWASGLKLVHDDRLKAEFKDGHLGIFGGTDLHWARMWITWRGSGMATMAAIAHELIRKYPAYSEGGEATIAFVYERLAMPFSGDILREMIGEEGAPFDPTWFQYWLNAVWSEAYRRDLPKHVMTSVGWIAQPAYDPEATPTWHVNRTQPAQPHELVEAVQKIGYLLLHEGVAILPPSGADLPTILHTNGSERLVQHPEFGEVPGGLEYIYLANWYGTSHTFTRDDIGRFPASVAERERPRHPGPFFMG